MDFDFVEEDPNMLECLLQAIGLKTRKLDLYHFTEKRTWDPMAKLMQDLQFKDLRVDSEVLPDDVM